MLSGKETAAATSKTAEEKAKIASSVYALEGKRAGDTILAQALIALSGKYGLDFRDVTEGIRECHSRGWIGDSTDNGTDYLLTDTGFEAMDDGGA